MNGQFVTLRNVAPNGPATFTASVTTDDGREIGRHQIYAGWFHDHTRHDPQRWTRDHDLRRRVIEADFGDCITVHKAQGSQWPAVATFLDRMGGTADDRARWPYTAITRAEKHLLLAEQ